MNNTKLQKPKNVTTPRMMLSRPSLGLWMNESVQKSPLTAEECEQFEVSAYEQGWKYVFTMKSPLEAEKVEEEYALFPYRLYYSDLKSVGDGFELTLIVSTSPQKV